MNKFKQRASLCTCIFFSYFFANAQIDEKFIKHLSENNLQTEHLVYLNSFPDYANNDSLNLLMTKYHLQYFDDSLFLHYYFLCKERLINDTNSFILANTIYLRKEQFSSQSIWFNSYSQRSIADESNMIRYSYLASLNPEVVDVKRLPQKLQNDFLKYRKSCAKNSFVAAGLSALIPGLGKLYVGRKNSFYTTLFTHMVYGVQSYESIKKLGINHPFSIFSIGFFSVFYVSNVVASFYDVNKVKKENKDQFLINASNYYRFSSSGGLYK